MSNSSYKIFSYKYFIQKPLNLKIDFIFQVKAIAKEIDELQPEESQVFKNLPSNMWHSRFSKRHQLSIRTPEPMSRDRLVSISCKSLTCVQIMSTICASRAFKLSHEFLKLYEKKALSAS